MADDIGVENRTITRTIYQLEEIEPLRHSGKLDFFLKVFIFFGNSFKKNFFIINIISLG